MSARTVTRLAWSLCGLTLVLVGCVIVFTILHGVLPNQSLTFLVAVVSCALVGAVVASRRPRNPVGWFFVVSAACFALSDVMLRYAYYGLVISPGSLPLAHAMAWPPTWIWAPGIVLILLFVSLYFPNGQLLSPRWRPVFWLALFVAATLAVLWAFVPGASSGVPGVTNPLGIEALRPVTGELGGIVTGVLFMPVFLASLASLVVRFWRSWGEERQQMKWLTYAAATMFAMILLGMPLGDSTSSTLLLIVDSLTSLVFAGIPVAVGIAVLRHRLYDIDIVINRTLVYGALTITLALVYFGGVTATQALFRTLAGQEEQPQLAVVVSTLVIAALFNPLRRRIQSFIDRRFYRRKYDARKTLEAFSAKLRDETDLEALNDELVEVVRETMQPAHVSLWLRHKDQGGKRT